MEPREPDNDEVQILDDVKAHERLANPEDIVDLSEASQNSDVDFQDDQAQKKRVKREVKPEDKQIPKALVSTESSECTICLDTYESGGERRCVVTKCGHIFCFRCIETVRTSGQPCPKCRKKLGKSTAAQPCFITIFDTTITVVDMTKVDEARKMAQEEKTKRIMVTT
jgi:hypothetical protein